MAVYQAEQKLWESSGQGRSDHPHHRPPPGILRNGRKTVASRGVNHRACRPLVRTQAPTHTGCFSVSTSRHETNSQHVEPWLTTNCAGKTGKKAGNEILKCVLPQSSKSTSIVMTHIVSYCAQWWIIIKVYALNQHHPAPYLLLLLDYSLLSDWQQTNKGGGGGGGSAGSGSNINLIKTQILGKLRQNTNLKINQRMKSW